MENTAATANLACTTCGQECKSVFGLKVHGRSHEGREAVKEAVTPQAVGFTATPPETPKTEPKEVKADFTKYKMLPPPVVQHLERTWGDWVNHFEIGHEYREDFGGYMMWVKVPKQYSTEWKEIKTIKYDNATHKPIGEFIEVVPDVRHKSLKEISKAVQWLDLVKQHLIDHAYRKGIRLPATNTGVDSAKFTKEQYESALAGTQSPIQG